LYAIGCRFYFTPLTRVLFTFPSRYWFTIGCQVVFSLIQWSGLIRTEFHLHRATWDGPRGPQTSRTRLSRSLADLSRSLRSSSDIPLRGSLNPGWINPPGLGCSAFARHYSRNHFRFLFLGLLRCFTSPRVALEDYEFILQWPSWLGRVVPFGNPRIGACLRLPAAYRSLLRPSSPPGTKAFTNCT